MDRVTRAGEEAALVLDLARIQVRALADVRDGRARLFHWIRQRGLS